MTLDTEETSATTAPSTVTAITGTSHTPSTLTKTPDVSAQLADLVSDPFVESLVNADPAMAALFATLQLRLQEKSGATSTEEDGAAIK